MRATFTKTLKGSRGFFSGSTGFYHNIYYAELTRIVIKTSGLGMPISEGKR